MFALRILLVASFALVCSALLQSASQSCVSSYGAANGGLQPCESVSASWMRGLARNCTEGDISGAYNALSEYCETSSLDKSHIAVRRPSNNKESSPVQAADDSTVEPQQWQSSSSSSKRQLLADSSTLSTLFAERSVRFAISGLLCTTLASFIFL
ncbi:hypothetical protein CC79DRAFT_1316583 [Sarocladium strictum]